jgi:pimeloyl-ACP methyl ester carboxylesterase
MAGRGHDTFHVAGNSLGGAIALVLGRRGSARTVCALSPAGFEAGWERQYSRASLAATRLLTRALAPIAGRITGPGLARRLIAGQMVVHGENYSPEQLAGTVVDSGTCPGFWPTVGPVTSFSHPPGDLPCPTTIAWGEKDRLLLYRPQSARAREQIPGARHVALRGCGHIPTWDDPEQVARVILETSA